MKIWIDMGNSPHVIFFTPFIEDFKSKGYEVIITARDYANTVELLKQRDWQYTLVGGHAGKNPLKKIINLFKRGLQLRKYLRDKNIDVAVSQSSAYLPATSWSLGIPSIYTNDNEKALTTRIGILFAKRSLVPKTLRGFIKHSFIPGKGKVGYYDGIKEGIYLHKYIQNGLMVPKAKSDDVVTVFFRTSPWKAQYSKENDQAEINDMLLNLSKKYTVYLLPRDHDQIDYYRTVVPEMKIVNKPMKLEQIYELCDLFIGAGGTMTRELAFLGVPTISVYQNELLSVDKYLINYGMLKILDKIDSSEVELFYSNALKTERSKLMTEGENAYNKLFDLIKSYE